MYTQEITSLQHPIVKHLVKLRQDRNYRAEQQTALLAGIKLISELSCHTPFKTLLIEENYPLPPSIRAEQTFIVPTALLKKVTGLHQPEPLAAEVPLPNRAPLQGIKKLLILDRVSDPGNLGTLFRTALALNWEAIFLTPNTCDPFNEKALRAAKGATFKLPFQCGTYEQLLALVKKENLPLIIADGHATNCQVPPPPFALVLGNESHGPCPELASYGASITIPINPAMESLNVATAGAILMDRLNRGLHV